MPPLLLNHLLLGCRSHKEPLERHLDVSVRQTARQMVDVLFPKTESFIQSAGLSIAVVLQNQRP